jgi:TolB protein
MASAYAQPTTPTLPFADLKQRGADVVAGGINRIASNNGRYETRVRLSDVIKQNTLDMQAYVHTGAQLRATAHRIADAIYEKLTGEPGCFFNPHRLCREKHGAL